MLEAYKIGILIALNNKASSALGLIARDFAKTDVQAQRLKKSIKDISLLTIGGAVLLGAGIMGLRAANSWSEAATRYEQSFARFRALNLGETINRDADNFAQSAQLMGVTATSLMTTVTDLHTVFGRYDHARAMAPLVARMEFANRAIFGDATRFNSAQALSMGKVIEMRGGFKSEDEMRNQIDLMQHVMAGTGGRVMPSDYLTFMKTAGVAGRLQTNQNFYYQMEPLIQEMGGARVGTALMSAYQNLGQGRTTARTAMELMRLGLVDPKLVQMSKQNTARLTPGAVKGGDMVAADPLGFLRTILLPAFAKKGITGEKAILNEIATIFTNRTAASLFSLIYLQAAKIDKNMAVNRGAMGINALLKAGDKTPLGIKERAAASIENFKTQMGLQVLPVILPLIEGFANGVQRLAKVAHDHPYLTKFLVITAMGLSAVAVVVGGIALVAGSIMLVAAALGGGISAGIALAIAGIGAAIIAFGAAVVAWWPRITGTLDAIGQAVFGFFGFLWEKMKGGWKSLVATPWEKFRTSLREMEHIGPDGKATKSAFYAPKSGQAAAAVPNQARRAPAAPGPWGPRAVTETSPGATSLTPTDLAGAIKNALHGAAVKLDGKKVGYLMMDQQGNAAAAPATGPSNFDSRLSPLRPNMALAPG